MNVGLIFGIIFATIVMGLVLFFGFKYIGEVMDISCESQLNQQVIEMEDSVEAVLETSMGSQEEVSVMVPACAESICFVDPRHPGVENEQWKWVPDDYSVALIDRKGYNMLIMKSGTVEDGFQIEKMKPYVNFCIDRSREVILRNMGTFIEVTLPEFG